MHDADNLDFQMTKTIAGYVSIMHILRNKNQIMSDFGNVMYAT